MILTLDAKRRLRLPAKLVPAWPGDRFQAEFDPEEDAVVFRRIAKNADWLKVLKACPVKMDDLPPRRRDAGRPRSVSRSCAMNQIIVDSIRQKRRLRFTYNGRTRIAEPQCYGIGTRGTELLRVHQIEGGAEREPLFDVSKIKDLIALDEFFTRPGPNYKKNDSAMVTIFSQL